MTDVSEPSGREHEQLRVDLGAYLLGGLPDDEARAVEAHLETCDTCRAERDELLPAVLALGDVRRDPATSGGPDDPPADLGSRILAEVGAEQDARQDAQRRRVWRQRAALTGIGAAAAAVVLVVGLAVTRPDPTPAPVATVPMEAVAVEVEQAGVTADADLVNHTWGVEVKLHGTGFTQDAAYTVMLVGTDGKDYPAGQFVGTGTTMMNCNLSSSVLRDQAAGFEVLGPDGSVVVTSTFA